MHRRYRVQTRFIIRARFGREPRCNLPSLIFPTPEDGRALDSGSTGGGIRLYRIGLLLMRSSDAGFAAGRRNSGWRASFFRSDEAPPVASRCQGIDRTCGAGRRPRSPEHERRFPERLSCEILPATTSAFFRSKVAVYSRRSPSSGSVPAEGERELELSWMEFELRWNC